MDGALQQEPVTRCGLLAEHWAGKGSTQKQRWDTATGNTTATQFHFTNVAQVHNNFIVYSSYQEQNHSTLITGEIQD